MLERVAVNNFRCLRGVDVPLRPLTVLVGPNDSGKSSFLDFVALLNRPNFDLAPAGHWQFDRANTVEAAVNGSLVLRRKDPNHLNYHWSEERLRTSLAPIECLRLPAFDLKMHGEGIADKVPVGDIRMNSDGSTVAGLLDLMLRAYRDRFDGLVERFRALVPGCRGINIRTPEPSKRQVNVVMDDGLEYPADRASSGVRMMLFFLTLVFRPGAPRAVLLEEPENGIHPRRLGEIMKLLRHLVEGTFGSATQVLVTTHSPYLLDHIDIDEDQILVFRREADGGRTAEPVSADRLRPFLDEFMLGEVWYNETEEGLVAKP